MPFTTVTVTGTIKDPQGNPSVGTTVKFNLTSSLTSMDDGIVASASPVEAQTDALGTFSIDLYATDDATTQPKGQVYRCEVQTPNTSTMYQVGTFPATYFALSASAAPTIDITNLLYNQTTPNAILTTIIQAKGDLIAGAGSNAPAHLAAGTNGRALVTDSTQTVGLKWGYAINYGNTPPTSNVQVGDLWFDTSGQ
jgi:hypothetical protein